MPVCAFPHTASALERFEELPGKERLVVGLKERVPGRGGEGEEMGPKFGAPRRTHERSSRIAKEGKEEGRRKEKSPLRRVGF
jgi:hypothetical protein